MEKCIFISKSDDFANTLISNHKFSKGITIDTFYSEIYSEVIQTISNEEYNCILFLEKYQNNYGSTFSRHLRALFCEKQLKSKPLFVIYKKNNNYINDSKIYNIFDLKLKYENFSVTSFSKDMRAFLKAYRKFDDCDNIEKLLSINDLSEIDYRFIYGLEDKLKLNLAFILIQFINQELIEKNGILIDEFLLAAKLGIDKNKSLDWLKLTKFLDFALYKGVLSERENKWWLFKIEKWIQDILSPEFTYTYSEVEAEKRVNKIIEVSNFKSLYASEPLKYHKSSCFDTVCIFSKKPIDKLESIFAKNNSKNPWDEFDYISYEYALSEENQESLKNEIYADEYEHLKKLRKKLIKKAGVL